METVESLVPRRSTGDSDPEDWEKLSDDVAVARATLVHNMSAHEDEEANATLASFTALDVDDTSLDERLQEMNAAMARLLSKGDEKVVIKEEADTKAVAMDTDPAETQAAPGDFVPEEVVGDHAMGGNGIPHRGFPENFPGIGKKSADLAKQLTKEEIAALFSKLKTEVWTRSAVERVLEVYQIYKRQIAQEKMLAAPFSKSRAGVGHGSLGQLDPGSATTVLMCPSCFSDWQRPDNKVQGKCKLCQKNVIAVDKGPPSAEIKLGTASWYMFCGPQGVTWHTDADETQKENASVDIGSWAQPPPRSTDNKELSFADQVPMALRLSLAHTVASQPFDEMQFAKKTAGDRPHIREDWTPSQSTRVFHPQLAAAMEIKKKSAGPVDQHSSKLTEKEFSAQLNPQLDVITQMQAGAHEVADASGASVLRPTWTRRRPGHQGEEFFAAQTSLDQAKASNKRMQEEGETRSRLLKPMAEPIDTWGAKLRAALEMNVFNPETPLKDMEFEEIEDLRDRYLNTKFLLNQSRNPFPASLLQELPCLAAQQREVEREQTPEALLGVPVGSAEFQIMRLKRIIELHMGEQWMIGGKWKKVQGPFEEIEVQVGTGTRPSLRNIVGPFHAKDDEGTFHWRKEVQTWDLVSLFSTFGPSYTARHLYAVWSHLPITISSHKRGTKNKQMNNQRRDDFRAIQKEAKDFVLLHDLPLPTSDLEWKQLYREMGSFFAAKVFVNRTCQAFRDFPEIYNVLSTSLGQEAVVEVKMVWRCNTEQWWTARLKPEYAGPICRKLGYSEGYIQGLGLGEGDSSAVFGAERIALNLSGPEQELTLPPITPDNVSSVVLDDYKRKFAGDKTAHVFWARMECGETRGGYVCRCCRGFWRGGKGSSRFLMITGEHKGRSAQLQLILDEPPNHLYEAWVKDRIEFYKRVEPMAALRDRSLRVNPNLSSRQEEPHLAKGNPSQVPLALRGVLPSVGLLFECKVRPLRDGGGKTSPGRLPPHLRTGARASCLGDFIKRKALPLVPEFLASTAAGAKQPPFPDSVLKEIRDFILPQHSQPDAGQPFFLDVIHKLLKDIQDVDSGYPITLKEG
ncbi:ppsC, partial [Symbiodinium necroappetens]